MERYPAGPAGPKPADPGHLPAEAGVRSRRRDAYVQAVARRSAGTRRADVQAYLNGNSLDDALLGNRF